MPLLAEGKKLIISTLIKILTYTPLRHIIRTRSTAAPITIRTIFLQKVLGFNRAAYWPVHFTSVISHPENILIGVGTAPGLSPGCYIQGIGKIIIGNYTIIGPNVGIISANHDPLNYQMYMPGTVTIGDYCWIGMNATILPNVILGNHTIVAAGAVVTRSFPEGYCILAGNPARIIKQLDPSETVEYENQYKYNGYIPADKFAAWRKMNLKI